MAIAEHIRLVCRAGGERLAIGFEGGQLSWSQLAAGAAAIGAVLDAAGLGHDAMIGLLGRNRLPQVGAFVAVLAAGRGLLLINAISPAQLIAAELAELNLACLIGGAEDLSDVVRGSAERNGTMLVQASAGDAGLEFAVLQAPGHGPFRRRGEGTLIEIQTSGTTGKPKRIPVLERTVEASLKDGVRTAAGAVEMTTLKPKSSPSLMFSPLVHTSGTFNTLMAIFEVRPVILFEKFDPGKYRDALLKYRPKFLPLPPTAMKMMLDSDATAADFSSVAAVRAGTAALSLELQEAFERKFGVPVLTTYGATEFMGAATSWTLEDHRNYASVKRGSVGRPAKGVEIRIVDVQSGAEMPTGESGILEARLDRVDGGKNWVRTTDIGKIDVDGFLYIEGRADDAISRGGFKIMAGKVADVLRQYPGVYDVIVVGRSDERLGEVPVAMIECYKDAPTIDPDSLKRFAKERLTAYEVPARFFVVPQLPRTVSDKISRPEVKLLLDALEV